MVIETKSFHLLHTFLSRDFTLICVTQIGSIAYKIHEYISISILLDLLFPLNSCFEWLPGADIVTQNYSVWPFIKDSDDASETLLSCCIPYLELDYVLIVNSHDIISKLNTNSNIMFIIEGIIH